MAINRQSHVDLLRSVYGRLMLLAFGVATIIFLSAPLLALSWRHYPFTGFLVEPTLAVGSTSALLEGGLVGPRFPERVVRIAGVPVNTPDEYQRVLDGFQIGDEVSVFTRTPDGAERLYPAIRLRAFGPSDMLLMFWLPYFVGMAYLGIGVWIYRLRGGTRPGRALAFFCILTAIICGLIFDLYSTHRAPQVFTIAIAHVGAALIGLAWRFPEEWVPVRSRTWILATPYVVSILLSAWGIAAIWNRTNPWAYANAWGASYRYAALGILNFLGLMLYRTKMGPSILVRRQARLVVFGGLLAFAPIAIWMTAPLIGLRFAFNPLLFLPELLIFPLAVAVAILRFRMWEIDIFFNHAFVYGAVTAILAGVFAALISLTQKTFILVTGEKSDLAVIISTLIIAAAYTPLKSVVQRFVDRELRDPADETRSLRAFGDQVQAFVQMNDVVQITRQLLSEAVNTLEAESGAISLVVDGRLQTVHTVGPWRNQAYLSLPLMARGQRYGLLQLGPHQLDQPYSHVEALVLQQVANNVAEAIGLAWPRGHAHYKEDWMIAPFRPLAAASIVSPQRNTAVPRAESTSATAD